MKLRNKKTGEILELCCHRSGDYREKYDSLAKLNEEWEDYKEGNYYWCIDDMGMPSICSKHHDKTAKRKAFGNYFATEEEAEKAVEKLKAWKRLKSLGFKFTGRGDRTATWAVNTKLYVPVEMEEQIQADLDLILGGEE